MAQAIYSHTQIDSEPGPAHNRVGGGGVNHSLVLRHFHEGLLSVPVGINITQCSQKQFYDVTT